MGFLELLTAIFLLLKVFGVVGWSWWIVFLPLIIALGVYLSVFILNVFIMKKIHKETEETSIRSDHMHAEMKEAVKEEMEEMKRDLDRYNRIN